MKKIIFISIVVAAAGAGVFLIYRKVKRSTQMKDALPPVSAPGTTGGTVGIAVNPDTGKPFTPSEIKERTRLAKLVTSGRGH